MLELLEVVLMLIAMLLNVAVIGIGFYYVFDALRTCFSSK